MSSWSFAMPKSEIPSDPKQRKSSQVISVSESNEPCTEESCPITQTHKTSDDTDILLSKFENDFRRLHSDFNNLIQSYNTLYQRIVSHK